MPLAAGHAVDFLIDTLMAREPGTVTLCPLGPLTNIALALAKAPQIATRIRRIVLMGGVSYTHLRVDRLPPITIPFLGVNVAYPQASAQDVEQLVTQPIENAVSGMSGVTSISSTSSEGRATVTIQFANGTNIDAAALDVGRRIAAIRRLHAKAADPGGHLRATVVPYIVTTARNWAAPIGRFTLTVDKGSPEAVASFCRTDVRKTGPTTFRWEARDYVPDQDLRVLIVQPDSGPAGIR